MARGGSLPPFSVMFLAEGTVLGAISPFVKPPILPDSTSIGLRMCEILVQLVQEGQLFRWRRRLQDDLPPVRDRVHAAEPRPGLHRRLAEGRRQERPISIRLPVAAHHLPPILA